MSDITFSVWKRYFGGVSFEEVAEEAGVDADSVEDCSDEQLREIEEEVQVNLDDKYDPDRHTDSEKATVYGPDGTPLA
jgi:hypothetical protein